MPVDTVIKRRNPTICHNPGYWLDSQTCEGCSLISECDKDLNGQGLRKDTSPVINHSIKKLKKRQREQILIESRLRGEIPPIEILSTGKQLKLEAKQLKIRFHSRMTRAELKEAIECAKQGNLKRLNELQELGRQRSEKLWAEWRAKKEEKGA